MIGLIKKVIMMVGIITIIIALLFSFAVPVTVCIVTEQLIPIFCI